MTDDIAQLELYFDPGVSGFLNSRLLVDGKVLPSKVVGIRMDRGLSVLSLEVALWRVKMHLLEPGPAPKVLTHCPHCNEELGEVLA